MCPNRVVCARGFPYGAAILFCKYCLRSSQLVRYSIHVSRTRVWDTVRQVDVTVKSLGLSPFLGSWHLTRSCGIYQLARRKPLHTTTKPEESGPFLLLVNYVTDLRFMSSQGCLAEINMTKPIFLAGIVFS